jgi:LmbE family N-acetylglucosaminyl deacetylase
MSTVVVLSPHIDDAVLSLGGTMHRLARQGSVVRVVTLFAGDPSRQGPPSAWDARRGCATAAEAFEARRAEERAAAGLLGVEAVWLPFDDDSYVARRDPEDLWARLSMWLDGASVVFVPGSPLIHSDHSYTTMLAVERLAGRVPLAFYAEQPYSTNPRQLVGRLLHGRTPIALRHLLGEDLTWTDASLDRADRDLKRAASRCYAGELAAIGVRARLHDVVDRVVQQEAFARSCSQPLPSILAGVS